MLNLATSSINKHEIYNRAYIRCLDRYKESPIDAKSVMIKLLFLGVNKIITKPERKSFTREEAEFDFREIEAIMACMRLLTPTEFMQLFPIDKEYDGHKWSFKDFFYTRNYINGLNADEPIGEEINHFLWEYFNKTVSMFLVQLMMAVSNLRRLEGQPTLAEEFASVNGLKTYTMHTDSHGREYLYDKEAGKTLRVKPKRHLHLVKK